MRHLTLRNRLLLSYVLVILAGAAVIFFITDWLARLLFDHRIGGLGLGYGAFGRAGALHEAFSSALIQALLIAATASLVVAVVAAYVIAGRILRPIDQIRQATRRMVTGHFGSIIETPAEPELAALVSDVNGLSVTLGRTEQRRAALISDVAHEMRTPLTSVRGYVDGLVDGIFTPEEATAALLRELPRLERLAADLAEVSRVEEGSFELQFGEEDLAEIASSVATRLKPSFFAKGVALELDLGDAGGSGVDGGGVRGAGVHVRGDGERLIQATTNLVKNALEYTPSGGAVCVSVVRLPRPALVVTDSGVGLTAEEALHVFERFYRGNPSDHAGGTGIGLTIARSIARAHGGEVTCTSPGRGLGSTFTLSLPSYDRGISATP